MGNGASAAAAGTRAAKTARKRRDRGGIPLFQFLTGNAIWDGIILLAIIANAAILGYDAHYGPDNPYHDLIEQWNMYFLYLFTVELVFEFFAQGPSRYFRNGWNIFDVLVVGISYLAVNPAISALRTLRVVRVFRLVSAVPQMRRVVEALFSALPGILAAFAILAVVFYIGAVMATTLFRDAEGFGDLGQSFLSLFALAQFDGWGETVLALDEDYPYAWAFMLAFTLIAAFAVVNLFVGVIVEAVQAAPHEELVKELDDVEEDIEEVQEDIEDVQQDIAAMQRRMLEEMASLRAEIQSLKGQPPQS